MYRLARTALVSTNVYTFLYVYLLCSQAVGKDGPSGSLLTMAPCFWKFWGQGEVGLI